MKNIYTMLNKTVSCFLMGGLGNQLFQIFTTFVYGMKTQRKVILPYTDVLNTGVRRPTYWTNFLSNLVVFTTKNEKNGVSLSDLNYFSQYNEIGFRYNPLIHHQVPSIMLTGYYQSYKYFDNDKEFLFKLIQLSKQKDMVRDKYLEETNDKNTISMHFRLGDYKYIQDKHPLMPIEYYRNSLTHISKNITNENQTVVIFFCEKEDNDVVFSMIELLSIEFPSIKTWTKTDDTIPDWEQMLMMSCCNYNIIANSTFSWWGGYFNENENKIVCYPCVWFGKNAPNNTVDLFPSHWKKIEFENKI